MPTTSELQPLLAEPREDLAVEYKAWLDLTTNEHRALVAKAAIALANHGGGYIVLGFEDQGSQLSPTPRPSTLPEFSQDTINSAIQRFATPAFHCQMYHVPHPVDQTEYPVVVVPGNIPEPVMSKRDCEGVISQARCYIRKPGPRSEEPKTVEEWRQLLHRCVLARREDMLEAIRSIVAGRVESAPLLPDERDELRAFCEAARSRWAELVDGLPTGSHGRLPLGYYEMGFSLVGAEPADNLSELQRRLEVARRIRLTGWPVFLSMGTPEWTPYPHEDFVEAWLGAPTERERILNDPAHADFWRASRDGKLYTIRGYLEDGLAERVAPGEAFDVSLPVWRIGEGILFASRLAEEFSDVEGVAVACRFSGLANRYLTSLNRDRVMFDRRRSRTSEVVLFGEASLDQIRDNLTEFMHQLLTPLYERFDFFTPPLELVETELERLRGGRF